ncbi:unnamed protein product [Porites lobata]|uniref:Uncharacterized protein n=1 Tax=Porites lobata TaxID=104759 RepID=A0ABN8PYC4_9CNID|nr:unnamed protein product [Porites lobata]
MGIDKRGVPRGKCSECECEEFESVNSIVCEYCGHPPVKHEKHSDILSPPAKKRVVSVSSDITQPQPLCNSTQVTFDPAIPDPDVSPAVIPGSAGLSEEVLDSSHSPSKPAVPTADFSAAVSNPLTIVSINPQTSSEYPLAAKNVISFLKNVAKEEGNLSTPVSRYQLSITEEGKLKVSCKVCKKDVLVGDTKHSRVQNLKAHLDSREHQLQLAILENEEDYPTYITASFREIDQAFPRMFLLTHKGAFCRVCSNINISLSGQRNPFGNAKQHVESKVHKTKMHGSSIVSSRDISSYFQAPPRKEPKK